ncbi:hypothetical protein B0H12DRAFT_1081429 [Mycena haematopus]|nr:hypothetical protein B0H12DRAFT_1081429 [Mycena haematopus]
MQDVSTSREAQSEALVEAFKAGSISLARVTLGLNDIYAEPIESEPGVAGPVPSASEVESFMEPFLDMCYQWTRDQEAAKVAGKRRVNPGDTGDEEDEDDGLGGGADDGVDDEERPSKRRLVFDEAELPWVKNESLVSTAPLRADLAETVRLLGVYGSDPKRALRSLLARSRVEFPESQWLRLLTNRPVDLDAVLTGIYSISASTAHTESVGDFDFTFNAGGTSKPTRSVVSHASARRETAATSTSAQGAGRIILRASAPSSGSSAVAPPRPRYLRSFIWSTGKRRISRTALGTETDPPFPGVPLEVFNNKALLNTVIQNPRLFKVSTPIQVDLFERLLASHPNQPLAASFCKGLREGFWPWSCPVSEHPVTLNGSKAVRSDKELAFLEKTCDEELAAGRFSEGFPTLLPGMHAIAIHAVPKPHSEKLRLVTDFSGGEFSRNSTISRFDTNSTRMDGIRELADHLRELRRALGPQAEINIFKFTASRTASTLIARPPLGARHPPRSGLRSPASSSGLQW